MSEVMIPPWVRPENPETIRWIDDATIAFQPAFGRGMTQRGIWADPRWGLRRRYRGLRSDEKAAILNALNETRGQLNILRVTPHAPLRGSFATSELLTNNTFASGTTGWGVSSTDASLSVSDRVLRVTRVGTGANIQARQSSVTVTQYAAYVARSMSMAGRGPSNIRTFTTGPGSPEAGGSAGMNSVAFVPNATTVDVAVYEASTTGILSGDYFTIPYVSFSRCALIDNAPNLLLRSDEFDNASWTKTRATVDADGAGAPDGSSTADRLIEDSTASNSHFVTQAVTVASSEADYSFSVALKNGTRTWAFLSIIENTSSTQVSAYINIAAGTIGTTATGANWSNLRIFSRDLGTGWYQITLVARKTNAATSLSCTIALATGDGSASYSGDGSSYISAWRATLAQSSIPTRLVQTTSAASTGTSQTGSALYTKGWPASESGMLLPGDWFEINGELKQITAPVNSDAAGLAYMQFRPGLADSPDDNDPIIVHEPFGRFIYPQGTRELENLFGIYGDCEMNLEEVYV